MTIAMTVSQASEELNGTMRALKLRGPSCGLADTGMHKLHLVHTLE
jgi:hypothetical protein